MTSTTPSPRLLICALLAATLLATGCVEDDTIQVQVTFDPPPDAPLHLGVTLWAFTPSLNPDEDSDVVTRRTATTDSDTSLTFEVSLEDDLEYYFAAAARQDPNADVEAEPICGDYAALDPLPFFQPTNVPAQVSVTLTPAECP